jgi:hypothetical protein
MSTVTVDNGELTDYDVEIGPGASTADTQRIAIATDANTVDTGLDQPLTDAELRADPVVVDLGTNNDVTVTGNVAVTNAGLTELAAAIDTELQVDVVGALPAGNNNIGDVDIVTLPDVTIAALPNEGQQTMANSISVAIASDQSAVQTEVGPGFDRSASGALNALDAVVSISTAGAAGVVFYFSAAGDLVGTVSIESSYDGGTNWVSATAIGPGYIESSFEEGEIGAGATWYLTPFDYYNGYYATHFRFRVSAYTSGSSTVRAKATLATLPATPTPHYSIITNNVGQQLSIDGSGRMATTIASLPDEGQQTMANSISVAIASNQSAVAVSDSTAQASLATIAGDTTDIETAVELIDDTVATLGSTTYSEATTKGLIVGAVRRDADTTLVDTTNEVSPLQVDANGRLKVEAFSGETLPVSLATLPALVAGNANIGDVDIASIAAGTNYIGKVRLTDGTLDTTLVDETGTNAVDVLGVGGGTPHDSVDSGNPVKVGFKAANALPTAIANLDRANGISDLWGRQLTSHIDPAMQKHLAYNTTSSQAGTDVITPTSGKKLAITSVVIGTYGTTAGRIILWFGDNADTTYTAGTDQVLLAFSTAPSSSSKPGLVFTPAVPVFCTTADRELHITTDANISLDIAFEYYEW